MSKKVIITDFEKDGIQYVVDNNLVVNVKIESKYYNMYNFINYIKSLSPLDYDGLEKLKVATKVQSTLYLSQSTINSYKIAFDGIRSINKDSIDDLIDRIIK